MCYTYLMTHTTNTPNQMEDNTYILTSRVQLKNAEKPYSETELLTILDIVKAEIIENSLGKHLDSYVDNDGILIISYEVPKIVGAFLWSAPESLDKALISDKTRATWEIERSVTYDDFKGTAIRK